MHHKLIRLLPLAALLLANSVMAAGDARQIDAIPQIVLPALSEAERDAVDTDSRRRQFAVTRAVSFQLDDGAWADDAQVWQLRLHSVEATSQSLRLTADALPAGFRLSVSAPDGSDRRDYDAADVNAAGELWTALVRGDSLLLSLRLPAGTRADAALRITELHHGFDPFWRAGFKAGSCNIDVACAQADPFRDQVRAVVRLQISGSFICSGTLLNNTEEDERPFVLTAGHCLEGSAALPPAAVAQSIVTYFNFEASSCGGARDGSLSQSQTGATLRARWNDQVGSDMSLIELLLAPNAAFDVAWAGWDRRSSAPSDVVGIHHPSGDEKAISIDDDRTRITSFGGTSSPGDGNYLRVVAWDQGTTEPGSSGAGLFTQSGRVVGQLSGGSASCQARDESDWYGRFATAWQGGGTNDSRLCNWLDPNGTGAVAISGRDASGSLDGGAQISGSPACGDGGEISNGGGGGGATGLLSLWLAALLLWRRQAAWRSTRSAT